MNPSDMPTTPLSFAVATAQAAGEILLDYFNSKAFNARHKSDHTLVTDADMAADAMVTDTIRAAFPNDSLVSEELHHELPDATAGVWVVDPLDGTSNFSQGLHVWGVSIARVVDGYPATAALCFPKLGELYAAQHGEGATMNGEPIAVAESAPEGSSFMATCSRTHREYDVDLPYKPRIYGSAAYDFCIIARGSALVQFQSRPKVWDIAGGWLVAEEAGGTVATFADISPWPLQPGIDYSKKSFPTLVAASEVLFQEAKGGIVPKQYV